MPNLQPLAEPRDDERSVEIRLNILRRRIALCREHLRRGFDAEFASVYVREINDAQHELAELLERSGRLAAACRQR